MREANASQVTDALHRLNYAIGTTCKSIGVGTVSTDSDTIRNLLRLLGV